MEKTAPILFLSGIRWDFAPQRHQFLVRQFARRRPVLFVEMGLSPAHCLRSGRETVEHWRNWRRGVREMGENLWLCAAPPLLPFSRRFLGIQRLNRGILFGSVRRTLSALKLKSPLVWISDPYFGALPSGWAREGIVLDWIHFPAAEAACRRTRVYEALLDEVRAQADLILTPSRLILERCGARDRRFHYLPHGVAAAACADGTSAPPPLELASLPRPIVGFTGTVGPSFDGVLVGALARLRPNWSFVLVGERRIDHAPRAANLLYLGPRPPGELPRYLGAFSAGIIPYRISAATETVHPIKTYEYLAAGLPVVSTPLPEIRHLSGRVSFAAAPEDFVRRLEEEMASDTPEKRESRRRFARDNTWEKRAEEIERLIASVLPPAAKK